MASESITQAWQKADELRRKWKAGMRPGPTIFDLAARNGVIVFRMVLDPSLSGAFVLSRRHKKSIVAVNTNRKTVHHQRFTAAHELGHLQLHAHRGGRVENVEYSTDDPEEHEANVFAAQFLVPLKELKKVLRNLRTNPTGISSSALWKLRRYSPFHHCPKARSRYYRRETWHSRMVAKSVSSFRFSGLRAWLLHL